MPLLVGLIDSAHVRSASLDEIGLRLSTARNAEGDEVDIDLEEVAAKRLSGGGLLDSIANMANSILGAGTLSFILIYFKADVYASRNNWYYFL